MTDHYVAYLNAEVRELRAEVVALRHQVGRLTARLELAHADRDRARNEADVLTIIVARLVGPMTAHEIEEAGL